MNSKFLLFLVLIYSFTIQFVVRQFDLKIPSDIISISLPFFGLMLAAIRSSNQDWPALKSDLCYIILGWFVFCILEVFNPEGASFDGWVREIVPVALIPFLIVSLSLLAINNKKDLNIFLIIVVGFSTLAALYGVKQLHIGLSQGDARFLEEGGAITHLLWGRLRVFSMYSEAAQFGSSQAHISLLTLILVFGPFNKKIKVLLLGCSALMFYGMMISGTRGAFFALIIGAFVAIVLSKRFKVLIVCGILAVGFICFLKFTYIGNGNYNIYRFRSALNPDDPSLQVRLVSQKILGEYMSSRPFGGGLGVIGYYGTKYNADSFLSTIQPDSYWVKIWAMTGIIGFTIWFSGMLYILGKCCGIVWRIEDEGLRVKGIAITSGIAGILFCSYGNEIINTMPSSVVIYMSWVFIYKMPGWDKEIKEEKLLTV
ncbi:O-antigen ligase family protein [Pedobacter nyackensis]|uniref:O-antigen ligase family protein n=1 Tax=Pedobacter nyackensis TaxID=475255 RepID=UPI002930FE6A|nr:O-antigen ligase family protein [Pedobacter nyackensis]